MARRNVAAQLMQGVMSITTNHEAWHRWSEKHRGRKRLLMWRFAFTKSHTKSSMGRPAHEA